METARAAAGAREVLSAGRLRDASVDNAVDVAKAGGSRMTMLASYRNGAVTHVLGAAKGAGVGVVVLCCVVLSSQFVATVFLLPSLPSHRSFERSCSHSFLQRTQRNATTQSNGGGTDEHGDSDILQALSTPSLSAHVPKVVYAVEGWDAADLPQVSEEV